MGIGQASQWAASVAAILMALAAITAPLLLRRTSRETSSVDRGRLEEEIRQNLLKGLAERVESLEGDVQEQATINKELREVNERLRIAELDCIGDRAQLRNQLRDQDRAIKTLTGDNARLTARVAELERARNGSC